MLENIIAKILAGASVGYITNDLAIKMLFQEYFKIKSKALNIDFSLGGVIVKEREEFQSQISRLVESDVIHHKAIDAELRKDEFINALQNTVKNLLNEELKAAISSEFKIADIPQVENSFQNLKNAFAQNLDAQTETISQTLLRNTQVQDSISEEQLSCLSEKLTTVSIDFFENNVSIEDFFELLLSEISAHKVSDFIQFSVFDRLAENTLPLFNDLHNILKFSYENEIDALFDKILDTVESEAIIQKLALQISDKKLHEIFTRKNTGHLPAVLLGHIKNIFQSDVSEDIVQTLLKFLLNVLKEEQSTVFDLLSEDLKVNFENFLQNKLPDLIATLIPWIRRKKIKLEILIQDSFKENTSVFGQILAALFIGNVGKYVGIEEKLVDLIEKQDSKELARRAADYLFDYLKNNTIGEIVQRLNQEKILEVLTPILQKNIRDSVENIEADNLQNLFDKEIKSWFSEENIANSLQKTLQNNVETSFKNNYLYHVKSSDFVKENIAQLLQKLKRSAISDLLPSEKNEGYAQSLQKSLSQLFNENQSRINEYLNEQINQYLSEKNWADLLQSENVDLGKLLSERLQKFLEEEFEKIKNEPLQPYLKKISQIKDADEQFANAIKNYLLENLENLMEGRIKTLVRDSLAKQPDTQLRDMVYKALGRELAPLSIFGAFLGAITGAFLLFMPEYKEIGAMLTVSGLAYGITGWGTNWIAIKMLFRPYMPVKIPFTKRNLLFTPGVIAKNKARFARSMGRFIGDRLLNQENLKENFANNRANMENNFTDLFKKDEYRFIQHLLNENSGKYARNIAESVYQFFENQHEKLAEKLNEVIDNNKDWTLDKVNTKSIEKRLNDKLQNETFKINLVDFLDKKLIQLLEKEQSIKEILPESSITHLQQIIEKFIIQKLEKLEDYLNENDLLEQINFQKIEQNLNEILAKNLDKLLNREQEEKLKNQIFEFLQSKIESEEIKSKIFGFIDRKISSEFAPEKNIKDIFGGKLLELLENNLNRILERVIQMGMEWLAKNKEKIADKVYEDAYKESTLAWTYKSSIRGTTQTLVEEGIPDFFKREFESLKINLHEKVIELGNSSFNTPNIAALNPDRLKSKVSEILKNYKLLQKIRQLTNIILEERIFKIPLNTLIEENASSIIEHLKSLLKPEKELLENHLKKLIADEKKVKTIAESVAQLLTDILERNFLSVKTSSLLKGISTETVNNFSEKITNFLFTSQAFPKGSEVFISRFFEKIKTVKLSDFADLDLLKKDLAQTLKNIIENEANKTVLIGELSKAGENLLKNINPSIAPETKDFIIHTASTAIFKTLENNIATLLNTLDFKSIVVREIENMHAKELENLFYGFARKYFKYLIGYGFIFGIIFGWAIDFGLLFIWSFFR